MKMDIKKLLVSFVAIASVLFLVASVSAASFSNVEVTVDSIDALDNPSVIAGELVTLKVFFTSSVDSSDIKIKAELEGEKADVDEVTNAFEVESGHRYMKVITLRVPYELEDEVSDDAALNLKIWGGDTDTYTASFPLRVQRPSYDVAFMSISTNQKVDAGELFPVDIVLKNVGYNKLDDLYVTVKVPELSIEKTAFFGDVVAIEDDDNDDTIRGRVFLQMPYEAETGLYTLDVVVRNNDLNMNEVKKVSVENGFTGNLIVSGSDLIVANPTNKLMVLRLVSETGSATLSQDVVSVPAGSSRTVSVSSSGESTVSAFTMDGRLVDTVTLSQGSESANNAVVVLTAILGIIFLVLLVVLVVLVTKKPQKQEDFGESYY